MNKDDNQKSDRREFLKIAAMGAGALGILPSTTLAQTTSGLTISENKDDDKIQLILAGYDYDRVKPLIDGKVKIAGASITFQKAGIGDINTNIFAGPQTYDVCEIGLHPFMLAYANDNFRDYVLLPIFPLRVFRHKSIFIRTDRGINEPSDLKGKRIGTPYYSSTSLTWIRGILQDEYGIKPEEITWVAASKDSDAKTVGKTSKNESVVPEGITVIPGPAGKDESDLLESGEIDALFHATEPRGFVQGDPNIGRLFPDYKKVEQDYYRKTGVYPIMHVVAARKSLLEKDPGLAQAIFNAYSESKKMNFQFMQKLGWAYISLPWIGNEIEETISVMGKDFWPYGIEPNKKTLETLFRYSYEQGLSKKQLKIKNLFYPGSMEFSEIN